MSVTTARSSQAQAGALAFADAALGAAGHSVSDPVLRGILRRIADREITSEQGAEEARRHIES